MSINNENSYDVGTCIAELYDLFETQTDDVDMIKTFIKDWDNLKILEPFCGTGRIGFPLARLGHKVIGMDNAKGMLDLFKQKIGNESIELMDRDVLCGNWPQNNDVVILGGNCFYELGSKEEQRLLIEYAYESLNKGGHLFIDSNHMEGFLDLSWQQLNDKVTVFEGKTSDGAWVEYNRETIWFDVEERLARFKREVVINKNGKNEIITFTQQKHPISTLEIQNWLLKDNFLIERIYGDTDYSPYSINSSRNIIWASKQ